MLLEFILQNALQVGVTLGALLVCVAYLTLMERKVIAAMQYRTGPAVNGPFGLLQPILDGVKLVLKEAVIPSKTDKYTFVIAPMITFFLALSAWAVIPMFQNGALADVNFGVMYLLAISSLGVYGVIIAGWASGSKYPFFGAIRSSSQMISYEVSMGLIIICVLMLSGSANLSNIINAQRSMWFAVPLFPLFIIFLVSILAETNRHPFDLPEAEAELVAGFNVEYSSMGFAAFFLGEYANMILMSAFTSILFLGGWLAPCASLEFIPGFVWMALKISAILFFFIWVRAALPRYRFDQLMRLGWKVFLPICLVAVVAVSTYVVFYDDNVNRNTIIFTY